MFFRGRVSCSVINLQQIQMKKQNQEVDVQVASPTEMRTQIKQNETLIVNLSSSIRKKRAEMKQFSQQMTKLLEKKLIPKNTSLYPHPNFNPQFSNPRNQALHAERQSIYLETAKLKQQISQLLSQEQPEVVNQIRKKQAILQQLVKEEVAKLKQKQMLQESLNENKEILDNFKQSQCLKEIEENQAELEQMKRQIKQIDRQMQDWMHEDIAISIYESSVNKHIQQMSTPNEQTDQVDYEIIDKMIEQIQKILEDRKITDREHAAKRQEINKEIKKMIEANSKLEKEIREITNQKLKKELERKKKQLISRNKSLPQIVNNQKKNRSKDKTRQQQKNYLAPSLLLIQPASPKQKKAKKEEQKPKEQLSTIVIGNWRPENHIKDDVIETRNIARAIFMKIRTKEKKITGIGVTYIDKIGVEVLGRSNIWKLTEDKLEEGEEEFMVDLQDVVGLYYYSPPLKGTENSSGSGSSVIGLKFMSKSSRPVIKIGQFLNQEQVEFLNLQNRFIKTIQFTLDNTYKSISGIKLSVFDIKQANKAVVFEADHNEQESVGNLQPLGLKGEGKNDEMMPSKWLTTTSQAGLTQKKVFIKNPIDSKKLHDVPQVDHRLMLNRKKKMV